MALLLGIAPYLQWHHQQAMCIQNNGGPPDDSFTGLFGGGPDSQNACPDVNSPAPWISGLGVLSGLCFAGFLVFTVQGVVARRREQALLRGAGIDIPEEDLPLEE